MTQFDTIDLQGAPLTAEERERLIRLLAASTTASESAVAHRQAVAAQRKDLLASLPARQAAIDKNSQAAADRYLKIETEAQGLELRLSALRDQRLQARCASNALSQAAPGLRDMVHAELRRLADPRIQEVLAWLSRCESTVRLEFRVTDFKKRNWAGERFTTVVTNRDDVGSALEQIGVIREDLQQLQVENYDPETVPEKLSHAQSAVESVLRSTMNLSQSNWPTRPKLSRF